MSVTDGVFNWLPPFGSGTIARMFLRLHAIFLVGLLCLTGQLRAAVPANARFVMSYFGANDNGGDERLYISTSPDGFNWTSLAGNNPVWQPPNWAPFYNVVRDPSIIYENGWYWVAFTSGNYGRHAAFGLVKSQDLLNWTYLGDIPVPIPAATAQLTWTPVFFRDGDGSVHLFLNISPDGATNISVANLKSYVSEPASPDWTQWTTPVPLNLPSNNTNEFNCWKEGSVYHGIFVDFADGGAWQAVCSTSLTGPWGNEVFLSFNAAEGGQMLKKAEGGYRFFFERGSGYLWSDFDQSLEHWLTPEAPVTSDVPMQNGKMIAMPGATNYAAWAAAHIPATPDPLADPTGAGFSNLLACALGLDPTQPSAGPLPTSSIVNCGGNSFVRLQYYQQSQFADVQTVLQSTTDLSTWSVFAPISITLMTDGSELVEGRLPLSSGSGFLRIQATQE